MLKSERRGPVLHLTLDRPELRNAFNDELIAALDAEFRNVDEGVRAVALTGNGPAFCAGGDLEWMRKAAAYTREENERDARRLAALFEAIVSCPAVVVAAVRGAAFGGGCGLVACADAAIAAEGAKFAFSEVRLGLVPATISPHVVPKIGAGHARALFATGEAFDAQRALRIGLVHEVVPDDGLEVAVEAKLRAILSVGPRAAAASKALALRPPMDAESAARLLAETRAGEESREGIAAFLEKRKAAYVVEP